MVTGSPNLVVFNRRDAEVTASISVESGEESLLSTEESIQPDQAAKFEDVFSESGTVAVTVAVDGGPDGSSEFEVSKNTTIQGYVRSDAVEFEKM